MAAARTIAHIDLDAFFVAVEQLRDPSLRGRPVIVGGDPDGRGVVSTASYEARAYGVSSGMPLSTARRLCPQATFVRGNFRAYQDVSRRFHAVLRGFSPLVEPGGLDEAYVDLTGCGPVIAERCRLGDWESLPPADVARAGGEALRRAVREELGLAASVGIATGRSLAKIASDAAKPDGLLLIPEGEEASFLAPRSVRDLPGLGAKAEAELARLGVRTLGQLAGLPESLLRARFGTWGPVLGERARGIDPTPVAADRDEAKSVSREGTYAHDVTDPTVLRASLRGYAESVGAQLRRMERRARCVTLKLRYGDFTTVTRSRTLEGATYSDDELYRIASELLAEELSREGRAVRLVGLGASALVEDAAQLDLFDGTREQSEALARSIDAVRAKYGHRSVQTGLTFFDPYAGSSDWEPERQTGLSSQLGLRREEPERAERDEPD